MQQAYSFDKESLKKIGINALIIGGSTAGIYALEGLKTVDFGVYAPFVLAIITMLIKTLQHYIQGE